MYVIRVEYTNECKKSEQNILFIMIKIVEMLIRTEWLTSFYFLMLQLYIYIYKYFILIF